MEPTYLKRFLEKINKTETCWLWTAAINNRGYGVFGVAAAGPHRVQNAHRAAYEHWVGPIPKGLEIDHLCRVKNCVNPEHLRVVTRIQNMEAIPAWNGSKTHCIRGHSLEDAYKSKGIMYRKGYARRCKECHKLHMATCKARKIARLNSVVAVHF